MPSPQTPAPLPDAAPLPGNGKTYEIVSASTPEEFSERVSEKLASGWKLYGSPFFGDSRSLRFHQAIVY